MNFFSCHSPQSSSHSTFDSSFRIRSNDSYQGVRFADPNSATNSQPPRPRYRLSFLNSDPSVSSASTDATPTPLTNLRDILLSPFPCISRKPRRIRSPSSASPRSDVSPLISPASTPNEKSNHDQLWVNPIICHKPCDFPSLDWDISSHPSLSYIRTSWWMESQMPNDFVIVGCHTAFIILDQRIPRTASRFWNILLAKHPSSEPGFRFADILFAIYDHFNAPLSKTDLSRYSWAQQREMGQARKERIPGIGKLRRRKPPLRRVDTLSNFTVFSGLRCLDVDNGCCIFELKLRKRLKPCHLDRGGLHHRQ
ncbi:hypothetical protein BDN72DRAFT_522205 [Pluteus cervinus]|uniref:Uncharacterized protein n=1 Tax=Pluteus cervinus TaxID=181527 RepID=A0ACD3AYD0_9AGAR|nr:hypothetical protein BDN72DRAFT_522205 [Pluteus cervinus]